MDLDAKPAAGVEWFFALDIALSAKKKAGWSQETTLPSKGKRGFLLMASNG